MITPQIGNHPSHPLSPARNRGWCHVVGRNIAQPSDRGRCAKCHRDIRPGLAVQATSSADRGRVTGRPGTGPGRQDEERGDGSKTTGGPNRACWSPVRSNAVDGLALFSARRMIGGHLLTPRQAPMVVSRARAGTRADVRSTACVRDSTRFAAAKIAYRLTCARSTRPIFVGRLTQTHRATAVPQERSVSESRSAFA